MLNPIQTLRVFVVVAGLLPGAVFADSVLYRQTGNYQNGGPSFAVYTHPSHVNESSEAADDFEVTDPDGWLVAEVGFQVHAFPNGTPPDLGINVNFHLDNDGRPSETVICNNPGVSPYEWQTTFGNTVRIDLPVPCDLPQGRYWISMTANTTGNIRYWWGTTSDLIGAEAMWRNPADGFETGCIDWSPIMQCFSSFPPPGPFSFSFWLIGRSADEVFADDFEMVVQPPLGS